MKAWLNSVYSDGSKYFVSNPLPKRNEIIKISIRVRCNDELKHIILRTKPNGVESLLEMCKEKTINGLDYYSTSIRVFEDMIHYHFYLVTDTEIYYYNQLEITEYIPNEYYDFKILINYTQPTWVKEAVFYQIFPERFCNGNKNNDVKDNEYVFDGHPTMQIKDWTMMPLPYDKSFCLDFYGGDLEGILEKIPYLKRLGVNAIYLNPIFYAATVHKYDCLDYFTVDPHFGGNIALEKLTKELHKNGMHIILDVSINHTGTAHKWFNKEGIFFDKAVGAYNNPTNIERSYYFFDEKNNYRTWAGVPTLPVLDYRSQALRDTLYRSKDSFIKKFLNKPYEVDGWRFDVADVMARNDIIQLHHEVWPELRKAIKEVNNNAYILAEDWSDCEEFLRGNEWDSSMNYFGFTRPIREYLGEIDLFNKRNHLLQIPHKMTSDMLISRFKAHLCRLPYAIQQNQFNMLDSHDIARLHNNQRIKPGNYQGAVILMFTMIGTASIYYGDEAKINGLTTTNEGCRYPMPWQNDFEKESQYKLYQTLAHLKQNENALKYGGYKFISNHLYTLGLIRFDDNNLIISIISTDNNISYIDISLNDFGKPNIIPKVDIFNTPLEYEIIEIENEKILRQTIMPNQAYIYKI